MWVIVAHVEYAGAGSLVADTSLRCGQTVRVHLPVPGCSLGQIPLLQNAYWQGGRLSTVSLVAIFYTEDGMSGYTFIFVAVRVLQLLLRTRGLSLSD